MAIANEGSEQFFAPNDIFRRARKIYLICIGIGIPLLLFALVLATTNVVHGSLTFLVFFSGLGSLIYGLLTRGVAICPQCSTSLMWKKGPVGTGRISLLEKSHCPSCGLDLNVPWVPEHERDTAAAPAPASEVLKSR